MREPGRWRARLAKRLLPAAATRPASLRAHLLSIVLVALLPLLIFSLVLVVLIAREERDVFRRGASARTLALLTAVDRELNSTISALEVLATSEHLSSGRLEAFQGAAARALGSQPEWMNIHLALPSGQEVVNLERPYGAALHTIVDRRSFEEVLSSRRPAIGTLFEEPISRRSVFPVRVPVVREGRVEYVLTALVRPEVINDLLLAPQHLPRDWVGVVLDGAQTIVARTIEPERWIGRPASESLRTALASSSEGWFRGATLENWDVYTPYHRSAFSGWTVAMGIPATVVEASLFQAIASVAGGGLALLGLATALAWLLSRRSARSIEALAQLAGSLGREELPEPMAMRAGVRSRITEVDALREAVSNAARLIQQRSLERDRVEASLRDVEAELREIDRRKDEFLAMIGHELRNPLNVLSTAVQLLPGSDPGNGSEARSPRAMIERQVAHMARLLEDLLDVSRIAAGRARVERALCDFVEIVCETVEDHRIGVEEKGLKLELDVPDRPLWVSGDRVRLAQVVSNLLHNAEKFTDPGGSVRVQVVEAEDGSATLLNVRDTGVGMEPEFLEHAFDPFSQADRTLDRSRGGLGLGLPLVKGLVELHGGEVSATSEGTGRGTTLSVRLPLEPATVVPEEPTSLASPGPARRILVIEDNRMAASSLAMFLTQTGYTVEVAYTGTEGLEKAQRFRPDVVLCDIGLPGSDGYDVARVLRSDPELGRIHLIAITGYARQADRERARAAGFDLHLSKPVNLDELNRILAAAPAPARR